jgi:hypothetical protein
MLDDEKLWRRVYLGFCPALRRDRPLRLIG